MNKLLKSISIAVLSMLLWAVPCICVCAQSGDVVGDVMEVKADITAYSEKDTASDVVVNFSSGDHIFILGQEGNWIKIFYQGKNAYVPAEPNGSSSNSVSDAKGDAANEQISTVDDETAGSLDVDGSSVSGDTTVISSEVTASFLAAVDNSGLEEEFEKQWESEVAYIDSVEEQREQEHRANIWRVIIIITIAVIVVTSIVPVVLPKLKSVVGDNSFESRDHGRRKRKSNRRRSK